jgi:Flp pilus assembly protein TadG
MAAPMQAGWAAIRRKLLALRRDRGASAAIEFAGTAGLLSVGLLNAVDVGYYMYQRMQVENAAQVGAQAAWKTCPQSLLPATQNCVDLNAAITAAIHSTSLGTAVGLASGYPAEGYYCVNASNLLQSVGTLSNRPTDCSTTGNAAATPGDYIQIRVSYSYAPLFPGITVMSATGISSITMTSWMRLG